MAFLLLLYIAVKAHSNEMVYYFITEISRSKQKEKQKMQTNKINLWTFSPREPRSERV